MTRAAPYGSPEWRAWKHQHHWATTTTPIDPLGAGNTKLLSDLGVTPVTFHDVRRNLTVASGTASALADVKGDGTYGAALQQATQANQPAWDGTTLNFDGSNDFLLSASALSGVDLSTAGTWTAVFIGDVPSTTFHPGTAIGAAAGAAPWWRPIIVRTGPVLQGSTDKLTLGGSATLPTPGSIHLFIATYALSGTTQTSTIEIPPGTKGSNGGAVGAEASASMLLALGADTAGASPLAIRYRASLLWQGGYTTVQKNTLVTYAQTYHSAQTQ